MPYSDVVLDHYHSPRNMRVMERLDAEGVAGEPGRGTSWSSTFVLREIASSKRAFRRTVVPVDCSGELAHGPGRGRLPRHHFDVG